MTSAPAPTVRRLIVYVLLFALVVIAAIGLAGLLGRVFGTGVELVGEDTAGLARSLAFALIGGPLAGLLWWVVWRGADGPSERGSLAWGFYATGVSVVSLIVFASSLLSATSSLIGGHWRAQNVATGLVWAALWLWHRWMSKHPRRGPLRLVSVAPILGAAYGVIIGTGGAVVALGLLLDHAIQSFTAEGIVGQPWWRNVLGALVWAAGGMLIWWWHWVRSKVRLTHGRLAHVVLAVVGILGGSVLALFGAGITLYVLLRLAFDPSDPGVRILEPLGYAVASAVLGALVLTYHNRVASERAPTGRTARLVISGVALVATASGVGVIVNSLLAAFGNPLAGSGVRALLLGGISSFLVGAPMWWRAWEPTHRADGAEGFAGRRIYLIAVFGFSAVSALVTVLVLGYRLFEFTLAGQSSGVLVDRVRAPLGLFVATAMVAAYHFSVWRHDRAVSAELPGQKRTIDQVILVATGEAAAQQRFIEEQTGATVTVWRRELLDAAIPSPSPDGTNGTSSPTGPPLDLLADALKGVNGKRVLVVTGPGSAIDVIPLMD